jgi:hypothetical protein
MTSKLAASLICCFYIGFWGSINLLRGAEVKGGFVSSSSGWPMTQSQSIDTFSRGMDLSPYFEAQTEAVCINLVTLLLGTFLVFVCSRRLIERMFPEATARRIVRPDFLVAPGTVDFRPQAQPWALMPSFRTVLLAFAILAFLCANGNGYFDRRCACVASFSDVHSTGFPLTFWRETTTFDEGPDWKCQRSEQWFYGNLALDCLLGFLLLGGGFRLCRKYG